MEQTKHCSKCETTKSLDQFGVNKWAKSGYKWCCRNCEALNSKNWARKQKIKNQQKEGLSVDDLILNLTTQANDLIQKLKKNTISIEKTKCVLIQNYLLIPI